jgi:PAS domain S-box-containing protein
MNNKSPRTLPLERMLDLATDAIVAVDAAQRIVMFNQGAVRIFGYTAVEVIGQSLDMLVPHRVLDTHRRHVRDFSAAEESARPRAMGQQREVFGRRKDGSEFPAEASIVKLIDHGQITFTVILRDTSERKRVEDELRQTETRHRLLIDGVQDYAIYMLDPTGHVVSWNVGAERINGYEAPEIIGRHFACFFVPEDIARGKPETELHTALTVGRCVEEGWRVRKDGSRFWASVVVTAVRDEYGLLCGFAKVTHDSTERRQADATLRWYANQLHILYEISRAILVAQSPQAIAEATLPRLRRLVPCQYAHVVSVSIADTGASMLMSDADDTFKIHPTSWAAEVSLTSSAALLQEHAAAIVDLENEDLSATAFKPFREVGLRMLVIAPLVAHDVLIGELVLASDGPAAFDASHVDIIRQVADQLAIALQHAKFFEEVQQSRERLQGLSHRLIEVQEAERRRIAGELHDEIGQALTIVKMNLQAAQRPAGSIETDIHLGESVAIVERALEQVRNLSLDLRPSLLDDLGLVAALRWYVARQARLAGFVLHFSVDDLGGRLTPALETTCFRVAQEALTNIVRHAQAREVWVRLACDDELCLTIRDDGVGFDVSAAHARASHGESFGLLGMRERVGIVDGHLTISSSLGQGTLVCACFSQQMLPAGRDEDEWSMPG